MSETPRPDPPTYTPPAAPAPNADTRVRPALAELLARPGLPNLFIFSLANLLIQINRLPPPKAPITSLPQSSGHDAVTSTEPIRGGFPTFINAKQRIRPAARPAHTCFSPECIEELEHACFSDTYRWQDLRWRLHCPTHRRRSCPHRRPPHQSLQRVRMLSQTRGKGGERTRYHCRSSPGRCDDCYRRSPAPIAPIGGPSSVFGTSFLRRGI